MAATVAASAGAGVLTLEERGWAGGRLGLQVQPLQGPASIYKGANGVEFCKRLLDEAVSAGAEVALSSTASDMRLVSSGPPLFALKRISGRGESQEVRARAVILACGSREPGARFPGSELGGVMLSGDAQARLNLQGVLPGRRVLIVGSDNGGLFVANDLREAGAEVVAVVEEAPRILGRDVNAAPLREAGVPMLTASKVVAALGKGRVESAIVARVDSDGAVASGTEQTFEIDAICLALPRTPASELAAQAGCPLRDAEVLGGLVPIHNRLMTTPVPGLYVCGDVAGVENGAVSLESGRLAGLWAASGLGYAHPRADTLEKLARARLGYLRRGGRGLLRRKAKAALAAEHRRVERGRAGG
jgi:thioredoxin reductase